MIAANISKTLTEIIPLLDSAGIEYWLARGVLRNLYLRGVIGDSNSDLDFHIWEKDSKIVEEKLLPVLMADHPNLIIEHKDYKLAFYTPLEKERYDFFVEFMYLNKPVDGFTFHERHNGRKYANTECFKSDRKLYIEYEGQLLRIPALVHEYLLGTYGPRWRENRGEDKHFNSTPEFLRQYK